MGLTIHYRGSLADLDRVEDFEDRVLDLALEIGGQARIWRSTSDDLQRTVRGVMLNLFPGQEPTSLLLSPEGWLVNVGDIEDAETGQLAEPSWCWVKTQFGPVEGHVALVELLAAVKREFIPNLEVRDEGEYWETRNLPNLIGKFEYLQAAINGMAEGLSRYSLSSEAAEDPTILLARIERIARLVQQTLSRPSEHPPVRFDGDEPGLGEGAADDESHWDASYKENRRRQERVHRAIEEHLARGDDVGEAFDAAMREETSLGLPEEPHDDSPHTFQEWADAIEDEDEDDEPWKESLPEGVTGRGPADDFCEPRHHPLQRRAMDLLLRLDRLFASSSGTPGSHGNVLLHGIGEIGGGLAQALGGLSEFASDASGPGLLPQLEFDPDRGLAIVQLKRALRGAAFALGALFPLRAEGTLDEPTFKELRETIQSLQTDIFAELARIRRPETGS